MRSGGGIAKVAKHEPATTPSGVRVFLHGVELGEIRGTTPLCRSPIDAAVVQRLAGTRQAKPASGALPRHELPRLQAVEKTSHTLRAPESWRQASWLEEYAAIQAVAGYTP